MIRPTLVARCAILSLLAWAGIWGTASADTRSPATEANYRVPHREYVAVPREWRIYAERSLVEGDSKLAAAAEEKLARSLREIYGALPEQPARQLGNVTFYLMWGDKAPEGGERSGMRYVPQGATKNWPRMDPRWNHAIVIYSAENLLYLDAVWSKKALTHELAHAWHLTNWPAKHAPIVDAYNAAKASNLYLRVKDIKGGLVAKSYATHNQLEYFAELSAMYFVGGNYYPFDRARLVRYDPVGTQMLRSLWGAE